MHNKVESVLQQYNIILFDEVCVLCNGWVSFLLQYDRNALFKIASVQSPIGQEILSHYQMPLDHYDTMLTIVQGQLYTESAAFLKVMQHLGFPFKGVAAGWIIPPRIRDFAYHHIASNRYRLFGKTNTCILPNTYNEQHFLEKFLYENTSIT